MASDDENTTTWVQTPEEKAGIQIALKVYLADEEHDHLKITRPPRSEAQQEEQGRIAEEIVARIAAEQELKAKKALLITGAILLVVAIAVGVGMGVSSSSSNSTPAPTPAPTGPPAPAPSPAPSQAPSLDPQRENMIELIQSRSASTTFTNSSSPQSQSLDWILSDPFSSGGLSDDRLVQRFALATLYYSTNGTYWDHDGWLNSTNECDWDSQDFNSCSQESAVQRLFLGSDSLSGRIPIEIGLLTHLTSLWIDINDLTGSLPSELGLLNQLVQLVPWNNKLTGSIPSELGLLTHLKELHLARNLLTGSIPSELGRLTHLTTLFALWGNDLTGSMPSSLCSAGVSPHINCGEFACTCCLDENGGSCPPS